MTSSVSSRRDMVHPSDVVGIMPTASSLEGRGASAPPSLTENEGVGVQDGVLGKLSQSWPRGQ